MDIEIERERDTLWVCSGEDQRVCNRHGESEEGRKRGPTEDGEEQKERERRRRREEINMRAS